MKIATPFCLKVYFTIALFCLLPADLFSQKPQIEHRQVNGTATVVIGLAGNANLSNPFDRVSKATNFKYKVTFLPPREQVESDFLFQAQTEKGRQVAVRLVRPGAGTADFIAKKIDLDLVFEVSLQGKKFQVPIHWTTGQISDAFGAEQGKFTNVNLENKSADIKLVGTGLFSALAKEFDPSASADQKLNFVIRLIMEGHLSSAN